MKFEEDILWSEGLFLQPHHLQNMQRIDERRIRNERSFYLPYTYGLIDFEIDEEALQNSRVVPKRISAVMPDGEEISMPGNTVIPPLDVSKEIQDHVPVFTIYLALPVWSEFDANLLEEHNAGGRRQFVCHETTVRDENTGENEITVMRRRYNVRLTTDKRENTDLQLLPILRLTPQYKEVGDPVVQIDKNYIPPFVTLSRDCPLTSMIEELNIQIANRRNKILHDLSESGFTSDALSGSTLYSVLQLRTLSSYTGRVRTAFSARNATPFWMFLELKALLGELSALQPLRETDTDIEYNHLDAGPQFASLLTNIRSLIMQDGLSSYIKLEFSINNNSHSGIIQLKDEHLIAAEDYYLALQCEGDPRKVARTVELGDNIKIVNPSSGTSRIRGIKLVEMRYPPRFLPALQNTIWFRLNRDESTRIWAEICKERSMQLEWAEEVFPKLTASLYITTLTQGSKS